MMENVKSARSLIFDLYQQPRSGKDAMYVYSSDPIMQLEELQQAGKDELFPSPGPRGERLKSKGLLPDDDSMFGAALGWSYRAYIVRDLSQPGAGVGQLPTTPVQYVGMQQRVETFRQISPVRGSSSASEPNLCLFNVIVALEWHPTGEYLEQLEWAFRRASDFLYDVTDGRMAFGQVVFGGLELMDCADIQIMASNQLHPRSWVGGLQLPEKYAPIRMGRGVWPSKNGGTIPWDEPEAYRTIIHEWGHYALHLRDQYLESHQLIYAGDAQNPDGGRDLRFANVHPQLLVQAQRGEAVAFTAAVPMQTTNNLSIMATLEGTSELAPQYAGSSKERKSREWEEISTHYDWLTLPTRPLSGPGRLPLPLPRFRFMDMLTAQSQQRDDLILVASALPRDVWQPDPSDSARIVVKLKRCWLYVVQPDLQHIEHVIAQGAPDVRFLDDGFRLLGARVGDTIVLVGTGLDDQPVIYTGAITSYRPSVEHNNRLHATISWQAAMPRPFPMIDVVSDIELPDLQKNPEAMARISVQVSSGGSGEPLPDAIEVRVFPRVFAPGQSHTINSSLARDAARSDAYTWVSEVYEVPALDGHVMVRWGDGLMISTFSHGGHPPSSGPYAPVPAPSISAGSSDGSVMLVFYHEQDDRASGVSATEAQEYSKIKVITMIDDGAQGKLHADMAGARAWSYPFSLTSNRPLPPKFHPTLVVHCIRPGERDQLTGDLLLCRLDGGEWQPQPTYLPSSRAFVATPLDVQTAGRLIDGEQQSSGAAGGASTNGDRQPIVEHFQLYWIPRDGSGGAAGQ